MPLRIYPYYRIIGGEVSNPDKKSDLLLKIKGFQRVRTRGWCGKILTHREIWARLKLDSPD
jgi:hypothetical protein